MPRHSAILGAFAALLLLLGLPSMASAASVTVRSDGVLTFTSSTTERNVAALSIRAGGEVVVSDSVNLTPVVASPCAVSGREAVCPSSVVGVEVRSGGGDDVISFDPGVTVPVKVWDGSGNDIVTGGAGAITFVNESGNDTFNAGPGGTTFINGYGRDTFNGAGGEDVLSYANAWRSVTATVDGLANDGNSREYDRVGSRIERIVGSNYNDRLGGDEAGQTLSGGPGTDVLISGAGPDRLEGGDGIDYVQGDGGADVLRGGLGNDRIRPGAESDVIQAGGGNDIVYAIGGGRDIIDCGAGRDRVDADRDDRVRGCEQVRR